jgi:hypothetical protein
LFAVRIALMISATSPGLSAFHRNAFVFSSRGIPFR